MRSGILLLGIIAFSVGSVSPAMAQRFSFERSFDVTGPSSLDVSTIRGKIEVTVGEPGRVVVVGTATVRVDWNVPANAADLARRVADNPPIQREGQTITLRSPSDAAEQRAVTVSYQVRVPPETEVAAESESGATTVRGVARTVVIRTQSGATRLGRLYGVRKCRHRETARQFRLESGWPIRAAHGPRQGSNPPAHTLQRQRP